MARYRKSAFLILLASALLLAYVVFSYPVAEWLVSASLWSRSNLLLSVSLFIFVFVTTTVLMAPAWILTVSAGYLYGWAVGTAVVSVASLVGAMAAFLVGRTLAREWVAERARETIWFNALDRAIRKKGFIVVLLTRVSAVFPYNLLNYLYGVSKVRFDHYVLGTWLGMLPVIALYVFAGSTAEDIVALARGEADAGGGGLVLSIVAVVAVLAVVIILTRTATRYLDEDLAAEGDDTVAG